MFLGKDRKKATHPSRDCRFREYYWQSGQSRFSEYIQTTILLYDQLFAKLKTPTLIKAGVQI